MLFLNVIRLRRLQTSIHAVQFFGHALPESVTDHNEWVATMDREIQNWQNHALSSHRATPDWFANAVSVARLTLHRPYLKKATLSDSSVLEVVKTAISIVNTSWKLSQTGYLIYPFHNVYNGFHAGLVLLYAMKYRAEIHHSAGFLEEVTEALSLLTQLFVSTHILSFYPTYSYGLTNRNSLHWQRDGQLLLIPGVTSTSSRKESCETSHLHPSLTTLLGM